MTADMTDSARELARFRGLLMHYAFGTMMSQAVAAAAELELPDRLGDDARTAAELAAACGTDEAATLRLLRCLAGLELVTETEAATFALTPGGQLLRRDHPTSMRDIILMWAEPTMLDAWRRLPTAVTTGRRVFDDVFGVDFFGHLERNPTLAARFHASMSQASGGTARVLPTAYDFGRFETIVDVGGGDGTLLSAVLREYPKARGIVFDTVEGVAEAGTVLKRAGVAQRCAVETGDFFDAVPGGGDLYLVKSVIHDWDDDKAAAILRSCRAAMSADAQLIIIEPVLPDTVESPPQPMSAIKYLSDLNMLVNLDGRERTRDDFVRLLRDAGFAPGEFVSSPRLGYFQLIHGRVA